MADVLARLRQVEEALKKAQIDNAKLRAGLTVYLKEQAKRTDSLEEQIDSLAFALDQQEQKPDTGKLLDAATVIGRLLAKHWSKNELKSLCLDLHITYDNLEGETIEIKAREIASYMARRNKLGQLMRRCVELRPKVQGWPIELIDRY